METSAAILDDSLCRGRLSSVVMYAEREWDTTERSADLDIVYSIDIDIVCRV